MNPGIYLFHKPVGPTSFSVVRECMASMTARPGKRTARICHGGTLDPFASGLLIILVEPATRLFEYLHAVPKVYEATVKWGVETDNGDPGGKTVFEGDASLLSEDKLEEALKSYIGWHDQVPHATSAKRVGGERAYLKAHRGEAVEMPPSRVYLHEACWLSHDFAGGQSRLRMIVRGGYYVRAMARDLGRAMGCGAHLSALHRKAIGPWEDPGPEKPAELHGRDVLPWLGKRVLSDYEVGELRQSREIGKGEIQGPDWPLPDGFPGDEKEVVRGFHLEKLVYLLGAGSEEGKLKVVCELGRGGI